ncbi:acyltransferase [candidate division KSB1 bacterium]|nr:acyltransferase [candidate division KSB1 bacterium]
MRVGFIQFKVIFGCKQENLEKVTNFILQNAADLLVLPELFNSGYLFSSVSELKALAEPIPDGPTTSVLIQLARDHCVYLVAGLPERDGEKFYNSAILVGPQGFLGSYRKLHLFHTEKKWFTPGDRPPAVYDIGLAKIGIMICFDWIFPEVARSLALNGTDLICHPSNLVLPFCQKAMITRSLENRVFSITANRIGTEKIQDQQLTFTGYSQIIDPLGNLLLQSTTDEKLGVVEIEPGLARNKNMTPANDLFLDRRPDFYRL